MERQSPNFPQEAGRFHFALQKQSLSSEAEPHLLHICGFFAIMRGYSPKKEPLEALMHP